MSVDYRVEVFRKQDDKKISEFLCNQFKGIFNSGIAECDDFDRFEYKDIVKCSNDIKSKMEELKKRKSELRDMIPKCQNLDVKHEIEDDIRYIDEELEEIGYGIGSCYMIEGYLQLAIENMIRFSDNENPDDYINSMAYRYNAEGLEGKDYIWIDDVYCKLIADY